MAARALNMATVTSANASTANGAARTVLIPLTIGPFLYVAETQTSKPGIWEKLKSAAVKPFVAALLAEAAKQVASGTAQAFLQITS